VFLKAAKMAYEQAQIPVQNAEAFDALRTALERIFSSAALEKLYRRMESKGVAAREFEKIVALGLLEEADAALVGSGRTAKQAYQSLPVSDQALLREFYLERLEKVDAKVRLKYRKVYGYY
jgi:hypothetical protein